MVRTLLLAILFLPPWLHAADVEGNCEKQVLIARGEKPAGQFVFGRASHTNLSLLRDFESIESQVVVRYQQEVDSCERPSFQQSWAIAKEFRANPTEANRLRLFNALRISVPIAIRLLLKKIKSSEIEDYLQAGYLGLWKHIKYIGTMPEEKLSQERIWSGQLNFIRRSAFSEMRALFRSQYSLTAVSFPPEADTNRFTFEEKVLLFGDSPEDRLEIAREYGLSPAQVEDEYRIQQDSIRHNELADTASTEPELTTEIDQAHEARNAISVALNKIDARQERVVRAIIMNGQPASQVAKDEGTNRENIERLLRRGLHHLRNPNVSNPLREYGNLPASPFRMKPARTTPIENDILIRDEKLWRAKIINDYLELRKQENHLTISILKIWQAAGEFGRYEDALELFIERNKDNRDIIYIHSTDFAAELARSNGDPQILKMRIEESRSKFEFEVMASTRRMRDIVDHLIHVEGNLSQNFAIFEARLRRAKDERKKELADEMKTKLGPALTSAFVTIQSESAAVAAYR